jgi:tetratricopeptide (TPR) repeat protein
MLGRWTEGLAVLTEAVGEAEVAPDLFSACRGSQYIAGIQIARGEFRVAHAALEKALSLADRMQNGRQMGTCMLGLATLAFLAGERDTAREMADRALPIMQALGGAWLSLLYSAGLSLSLSPEEWSGAPAPLKEGVLQTESGTPMASLRAQQLTAARHLAEGRPEEARQGLQWLLRDTRLEGEQTVFMDQLGAEIDAALDLPERALEAARRGLERAATEDLRVARCGWLRIRGLAYARLGSRQEADVAFAEAVALARQMPYPFREGAILLDWGRILASSGREDEGRRCLQQAGAVFEMLGAVDDHARVMKSLAALS